MAEFLRIREHPFGLATVDGVSDCGNDPAFRSAERTLVTGGAGFLGSHLCERLLREGHEILCVDNFYTSRRSNIAHLLGSPTFEFMRHDITFPLYVEVGEIYNLACPASPIHYQRDPVQTTKTSVMGAINMLGLAKRTGAKVLQASTSEVYGDPTEHPQRESYRGNVNLLGPRACYDEGKRCAETLFFDYRRQHRAQDQGRPHLQHLRAAHASRRRPRGLELHRAGAQGRAAHVSGDGSQTRSFCYVDDLIEGLIRLMNDAPTRSTGPINLGNTDEVPIGELAEMVIRLTGVALQDRLPAAPGRRPAAALSRPLAGAELLGYAPRVPLEEGLRRTIEDFRERFR